MELFIYFDFQNFNMENKVMIQNFEYDSEFVLQYDDKCPQGHNVKWFVRIVHLAVGLLMKYKLWRVLMIQ